MQRFLGALVAVVSLFTTVSASAQSGQGSLNGYVKDEQGGVLPGVTVTATAPEFWRRSSPSLTARASTGCRTFCRRAH